MFPDPSLVAKLLRLVSATQPRSVRILASHLLARPSATVRLLGRSDGARGRCRVSLLPPQGKHRDSNSEGGNGILGFEAETFY